MVRYCAAFGCSTYDTPENRSQGITFHYFPTDKEICEQWVKLLHRENFTPTHRVSVLCSKHFRTEDFIVGTGIRKKLKKGVIPSIFEALPSYYKPKVAPKRKSPTVRLPIEVKYPKLDKDKKNIVESIVFQLINNVVDVVEQKIEDTEMEISGIDYGLSDENLGRNNCNVIHSYAHPPTLDEFKTKYESLRDIHEQREDVIKDLRKEVTALKRQNRILTGKIEDMGEMMELMKVSDVVETESPQVKEVLGIFGTDPKSLLVKKLIRTGNRPKEYDSDVITFAQTLRFSSPRAYEFLKTYFQLPCYETLNNRIRSFRCMPGLTRESFEVLHKHKGELEYANASLVLDEMGIKGLKMYASDLKRVMGTIDFGNLETSLQSYGIEKVKLNDTAVNALVVMLVGYLGYWKLPIAYFFTGHGLLGSIEAGIIRECVKETYNAGTDVWNVTLDGTGHNPKACEYLGAKLMNKSDAPTANDMVTSFPHPVEEVDHEISVYLDFVHMFKLLRNCLDNYKEFFWPGHGYVKWRYIAKLHELQELHGLNAANKLTKYHIK